eukprot:gnl/Chilomastix_caulleri/4633.p1 GENE.gnl/Chilomastix_caulleri/4633~~gnl/Chilomastix_caulleri/4633.p1  ORF type:complete len:174 (+),score=25.96 gnl/Chilomastix_caulleri/4633:155-676(+)
MICPSHGVVLRTPEGIKRSLGYYNTFVKGKTAKRQNPSKFYDTMYGSTEKMAKALEAGCVSAGINVKTINPKFRNITQTIIALSESSGVAFGSSIINSTILPTVHNYMDILKSLGALKGMQTVLFGSYGWSPYGYSRIIKELEEGGAIISRRKSMEKIKEECYSIHGVQTKNV